MFHKAQQVAGMAAQLLTSPVVQNNPDLQIPNNFTLNSISDFNSNAKDTVKDTIATAIQSNNMDSVKKNMRQTSNTASPAITEGIVPGMVPRQLPTPVKLASNAPGAVMRAVLEDILSRSDAPHAALRKTAGISSMLRGASRGFGRFADAAGDIFRRINAEAGRAASVAQRRAQQARAYIGMHKNQVAGLGGLGGVGAGAAFLTPEIAETLSQTARSGYVYGRRAMRLDDAMSAANGTDREGR